MKWIEEKQALYKRNQELVEKVSSAFIRNIKISVNVSVKKNPKAKDHLMKCICLVKSSVIKKVYYLIEPKLREELSPVRNGGVFLYSQCCLGIFILKIKIT